MKYVILIIVSLAAAVGIMLAAYGKKGLQYRKEEGANDIVTAIMMAVIIFFWGLDLIGFITATESVSSMTYIFVFGAPVLLIVWILYSRFKIKQEMAAPPKPYKKSSRK
ncbi:MAG: hypothetical protein IJ017_06440 [Oscillospiraceae bacterium]|nr:hypothetical protein [Oscillospiraceae bacterium]